MNIFTYGTLMFPDVMYGLVHKKDYRAVPVTLQGYTRRQVKNKCYPGIIPQPHSLLKGVLYENVTPQDVKILHYFEGDEYQPITVKVTDADGNQYQATAYLYGGDPNNLEPKQWDLQKFEKQHKTTFASQHLNSKQDVLSS